MKKALYASIAYLLCAGCVAQMNKIMASWKGHNISDVIAQWGPPSQVIDDEQGGKIYSWIEDRSYTTPKHSTTYTQPTVYSGRRVFSWRSDTQHYGGREVSAQATRTFWVDANGIIYRWAWRGF